MRARELYDDYPLQPDQLCTIRYPLGNGPSLSYKTDNRYFELSPEPNVIPGVYHGSSEQCVILHHSRKASVAKSLPQAANESIQDSTQVLQPFSLQTTTLSSPPHDVSQAHFPVYPP